MRKFDDSLPLQLLKAREAAMAFFRPLFQENGLTEQQWRILRALYEYPELESKQLAELCCILSPSLTGIIQRLEQQELIQRRKSDADQRRVLISMTPKARDLFEQLSPEVDHHYRSMAEQFSAEKLNQLTRLLKELSRIKP